MSTRWGRPRFRSGSVSPGSVGLWSAIAPPERAILIPLRIGTSPLGVIYADQVEHDGTLLPVSAVEMFGSLASTALENLTQRLSAEQRAETDPLTGLRNRAFLDKILEIELPRVQRYNTPLSLIMIDLDGFKRINDTWGHQFGDYILRETANLIQGNVRRPDVVVRYGGDEFVVLMVNTNLDQARLVCDRIEGAFVERNRLQTDERMMISISVGLRSADANSLDGILFDADMAMYAQKSRQRRQQLVEALVAGSVERIEAVDTAWWAACATCSTRRRPTTPITPGAWLTLALKLARRMGLSAYEVEILALAALLHDVGKVSLPTEILQKCAPLAPAEKEAMRHHPALGEEFFMGLDHMEPVRPLIRHHHERYDGVITGEFAAYPDGLVGEGIPLGARILKLAESVDSMLHDRPYRKARGLAEAKRILHDESGQSFDPRLVHIQLADSQWQEDLGAPARHPGPASVRATLSLPLPRTAAKMERAAKCPALGNSCSSVKDSFSMAPATQDLHLFGQWLDIPRYRLIACEVVHRECCWAAAVSRNVIDLHFLTQGLHDLLSERMRQRVQEAVDSTDAKRYQAVLLGYGLCNNGLVGVRARELPLVIPRAHDCITFFLGSAQAYQQAFEGGQGGTYYLTTGWAERDAENLETTLQDSDNALRKMGLDKTYEEYVALYGEEHARMIMQTLGGMEHYSRLRHVDMGLAGEAEGRVEQMARAEAERRGWEYDKVRGRMDLFLDLVDGRWDEGRFLVVPPGQAIAATHDERIIHAVE